MGYEEVTNLALRRGIFFPSAEIYPNSPSGFWEFGHIGTKIRNKILDFWRKELVLKEDFEEIFGCQILPEKVFISSGHLESFNDPVVQCKKCHSLYRADRLIEEQTKEITPESLTCQDFDRIIKGAGIYCQKCKSKDFGDVRKFNMMMGLDIGATGQVKGYLRPETCQNIFLDFQRVYKVSRKNLPLGIAQAGSAFRNEIAPRNSLLRERELGQMEIEIFFNPKKIDEIEKWDKIENYEINLMLPGEKTIKKYTCKKAVEEKIVSGKLIAYYLARVQQLYEKFGFSNEKMRFRGLISEERAFYAKETWDFEVNTSIGWVELIANNYRGDHDLLSHLQGSGTDLSVNEEGEKYVPHVFEISAGIDRTLFSILDNSFRNEKRGAEERIYLSVPLNIAPYHAAIFPLVKKDGVAEKANEIKEKLQKKLDIIYDEKGSIGRRYARVDEIGVPFAITVDYQTMEDGTVTLRKRDDMTQERVHIDKLEEKIEGILYG